MAEVPDNIIGLVKRYLAELEKHNFHIKTAILFGSYVQGNYHEGSDIDIALVSEDFEGIRFFDRQKLADVTLSVDSRLSPLPFRPEDFEESDLWVREIMETGERIIQE